MKKPIAITSNMKVLSVMWHATNSCNYNCSYCFDFDKGKEYNNPSWEQTKQFFEDMFSHYIKLGFKKFSFGISGGEPSIYKHLPEACKYIKDKEKYEGLDIRIHLNTNLSRSIEWFSTIIDNVDSIGPSFHVEIANPEDFLEKIMYLEDKVFLGIRLMLHKERFWEVVEFGKRLIDRDGSYLLEYAPLFEAESLEDTSYNYDGEGQQEFILKNHKLRNYKAGFPPPGSFVNWEQQIHYSDGTQERAFNGKIIADKNNFFKGWECDVGVVSLQLSINGALGASGCGVRHLGNWIEKDYEFPTNSIICPREHCHCGFDIPVPKRRI